MRPTPKLQYVVVSGANRPAVPGVPIRIDLPFDSDFILLPASIPEGGQNDGTMDNGDVGAEYGISINDPNAPELVFTAQTGGLGLAVVECTVSTIYIRQFVSAGSAPLYILVGKDCDLGFANAVYG